MKSHGILLCSGTSGPCHVELEDPASCWDRKTGPSTLDCGTVTGHQEQRENFPRPASGQMSEAESLRPLIVKSALKHKKPKGFRLFINSMVLQNHQPHPVTMRTMRVCRRYNCIHYAYLQSPPRCADTMSPRGLGKQENSYVYLDHDRLRYLRRSCISVDIPCHFWPIGVLLSEPGTFGAGMSPGVRCTETTPFNVANKG